MLNFAFVNIEIVKIMNAKLTIRLLFLLASLPCMGSCGDSSGNGGVDNVSEVTITVSSKSLSFGPEAGFAEILIKGSSDWAIRTDSEWVRVRPSGGVKDTQCTVRVEVTANNETDTREALLDIVSGGKTIEEVSVVQGFVEKATPSEKSITMGGQESKTSITINSNSDWSISGATDWLSVSPAKGGKGDTSVSLAANGNGTSQPRIATLTLECGGGSVEIKVTQLSDAVEIPEGYTLVWSDEFNEGAVPSSEWVLENWRAGYVNNELQTYTSGNVDGKRTVEIKDGFLNINCFKGQDGKVYSGRMNARPSTGWLYGYFEARIMLPKGKGTWPAFWMMPSNVDWNTNGWPKCGEIDIMEEVGANPDYVSSSLHTEKYNHVKGTQKTHEMKCSGAEGEFHTYALEWTEDAITTYVDGKVQLRATKAEMGSDHGSWPFHYAFYPILNLAWGGDWGGYKGIDESALPVTMKVDYVRVFQKK